ncbi:MAG: NAD(+) kinase [Gammaproteobacteria bacterium]|nr:NAD(+) kinase [Gammaproteobacteria bacterium]
MPAAFKSIALIGRAQTEGVTTTLNALIGFLKERNINIVLEEETAQLIKRDDLPAVNRDKLGGNCDLIIVVGGDGSLLNAAHAAADQNLPVVGINRGSLGFLTDICPDDIEDIDKILAGDYTEEQRFLLKARISNGSNQVVEKIALNDVVLLPSEINRMIEFSVFIDNQFVCTHRADGMIVATPTGSTAHALSGGGPILHPRLDALMLLPMFPHTLSSRPIVVTCDSHIELVMAEHCKAAPNISCDGKKLIPIPDCGKVSIKKHTNSLRLIHLKDYNYYETLRGKLHWELK